MATTEHRTAHPTHGAPTDGQSDTRGRDPGVRGGRRAARVTRLAADALHVRRAFGEPVRQGDVVLVPVAKVMGGSGSGYGTGETGGEDSTGQAGGSSGTGGGGGFALRVKPMGVYVVTGSTVQWRPALDVNRIILGGQIAGTVAVIALSRALRRRRGHR